MLTRTLRSDALGLIVQFVLAVINICAMVACFMVFQPGHEGRSLPLWTNLRIGCGRQTLPCSWGLAIGGCIYLLIAHLWLSAVSHAFAQAISHLHLADGLGHNTHGAGRRTFQQ